MTGGNFSCLLNYAQGSAPDQQLFNQIPNGKLDFKNQVVRKCIIYTVDILYLGVEKARSPWFLNVQQDLCDALFVIYTFVG